MSSDYEEQPICGCENCRAVRPHTAPAPSVHGRPYQKYDQMKVLSPKDEKRMEDLRKELQEQYEKNTADLLDTAYRPDEPKTGADWEILYRKAQEELDRSNEELAELKIQNRVLRQTLKAVL